MILSSRKAAFELRIFLVVIVALITLTALILLFVRMGRGIDEQAYKSQCKTSVAAYSRLNALPFGDAAVDEADIDCPVKFVTIEKSSPRIMKRDVANLMFDCWDNYGEGELRLFRATDMKFCAVCSVFQFEDRSTRLDHFTSFLMSEQIPRRDSQGHAPTYYDYISGVDTGVVIPDSASPAETSYLDGSRRYVVLFTFYKESWWHQARNALIVGGIVFLTVGVATAITVGTGGVGGMVAGPVAAVIINGAIAGGIAGGVGAGVAASGTTSADWQAHLVMVEYTSQNLNTLGCGEIPVSLVDRKFR